MHSVDQAAHDDRVVVRMGDVRHMAGTAKQVTPCAWLRAGYMLKNGAEERRTLIALRDEQRSAI
jgi:hypothetical protein